MNQKKLPRFHATPKEITEITPSLGGECVILQFMGWKQENPATTSATAGFWVPPYNKNIRFTPEEALKTAIWSNRRRFLRLRHIARTEQNTQ